MITIGCAGLWATMFVLSAEPGQREAHDPRRAMVRDQLEERGVTDPRVLEALKQSGKLIHVSPTAGAPD